MLDHCGKPDIAGGRFEPWASDIAELAGSPNVACKLSGLLNCAGPGAGAAELEPYAAHVLDSFGSGSRDVGERLAAARPRRRLRHLARGSASTFSPASRRATATKVLGINAERIYRL